MREYKMAALFTSLSSFAMEKLGCTVSPFKECQDGTIFEVPQKMWPGLEIGPFLVVKASRAEWCTATVVMNAMLVIHSFDMRG